MVDIDVEIRFDDAAALEAITVIRSAFRSVSETLEHRRSGVESLSYSWEGYAERWFEARNTGLELLSVATLQHLEHLVAQIESQREHVRRDRAEQQMLRVARAEAQRRAAEEAEQARLAAEQRRAAADRLDAPDSTSGSAADRP